MSLLEQNITKKRQVNKLLDIELRFNAGKNKRYKVKAIKDNVVHFNAAAKGQFLGLYYLVSWKNYSKNESI